MIGADPRGFGARAHIPAVKHSELLELVAICTAHEETARAAAEHFGAPKWYGEIEGLLSDPSIDLVTIAVRPRFHRSIASAVVESGKMVYCEWPLARGSEEAEQMASLARAAGVATAVGLQGRFAPAIQTMQTMIAEGQIGKPLTFEAWLLQAPFNVDSDRAWLTHHDEASGALHVATAHVTDALQVTMGELSALTAVTSTLIPEGRFGDTGEAFKWDTDDTVIYLAESRSGAVGVVSISNATRPALGFSLRIVGEEGQVIARSMEYFQFSTIDLSIIDTDGLNRPVNVPADVTPFDEHHPAANVGRALEAFARSVVTKVPFHADFDDGVALHRIIDAVAESSQTRVWKRLRES